MAMTINEDGALNMPPVWHSEYATLRKQIIEFCAATIEEKHPGVVEQEIANIHLDFEIESFPDMQPGGELVDWDFKIKNIQHLKNRIVCLLEFGNHEKFPNSISLLKEMNQLLKKIISVIKL